MRGKVRWRTIGDNTDGEGGGGLNHFAGKPRKGKE